jgi:hypothetical protein
MAMGKVKNHAEKVVEDVAKQTEALLKGVKPC